MTISTSSTPKARLMLACTTALAACLAAGAAHAVQADELAISTAAAATAVDPLTVTATRTEKRTDDVPVSVSVTTAAQMNDAMVVDLKDLVKYEPGVSVPTSPARFGAALGTAGRDGSAGITIRGLGGNRVLISVDGVRIPDSFAFGAQATGRGDYADLDTLRSVEIVRGPASALYGSDGLAGSVSFITKDPSDFLNGDKPFYIQGRAAYSSADEGMSYGVLAAGRLGQNWEALISYTRRDASETETGGNRDIAGPNRTTANPQDISQDALLAKLVWRPNDAHAVKLTYDYLKRETDTDVVSGRTASVLGLLAHDEIERNRVSLEHRFTGGDSGWLTAARTNLYYQDSTNSQFSAEDRATLPDRTRLNTFDNRVFGVATQLESQFGTGGLSHHLVWGGDVSVTRQEGVRSGTVPPAGETYPTRAFPNTDYTLAGLFVQDEITALDGALSLYPALRWDYYKLDPKNDPLFTFQTPLGQSDNHVSPKLGVVYRIDDQFSVFANVATGFKAPSPSQVNNGFANPAFGYRSESNPDLKPETSKTIEGGLRFRSDNWSFSATGYAGEYEDFIDQVQVSGSFTPADPAVYKFINIGSVKIAGIEGAVRGDLGRGFTVFGSAAFTRGDAESNGIKSSLSSVDPMKVTAGLSWRDSEGRFGGTLTVVHVGDKDVKRLGADCAGCFTPGSFTTADLTAFWNVTRNVSIRAGAFNLTDQKYWWWSDVRGVLATSSAVDAWSQPGRNYGVSITVKM